jgi:hypothetical protein
MRLRRIRTGPHPHPTTHQGTLAGRSGGGAGRCRIENALFRTFPDRLSGLLKNHTQILCGRPAPRLAFKRKRGLIGRSLTTLSASRGGRDAGVTPMQDLLWIGIILALTAASLGYVRLCGDA